MFTGLIEEVGKVVTLEGRGESRRLTVSAPRLGRELKKGGSIAVSGVCLTAVVVERGRLGFDLAEETRAVTTLGDLAAGDPVNLERPLRLGAPVGGHLVLGHVDGVGTVSAVTRVESTTRVRIAVPSPEMEPLFVPKGSVAVDGVSLTIAALGDRAFEVMLIPHTLAATTLGSLAVHRRVNIEADVIGKYVVRSLSLKGA